jgi:hypothetical protein
MYVLAIVILGLFFFELIFHSRFEKAKYKHWKTQSADAFPHSIPLAFLLAYSILLPDPINGNRKYLFDRRRKWLALFNKCKYIYICSLIDLLLRAMLLFSLNVTKLS